MNQQQSIFGKGKSQARRFNKEDSPVVTFEDVAGADGSKAQLEENDTGALHEHPRLPH